MNPIPTTFMIISGEASGDLLGSALAREIHDRIPSARLVGVGGDAMAAAGVELLHHVRDLGVTGFTEVIGKLRSLFAIMRSITDAAKSLAPTAVILIDYPDFNLRLAPRLKKNGHRVIYYVSPQLWAWRSGRISIIRDSVDRMLVLFPFEHDWYAQRGVDVSWVGHPILDRILATPDRATCRSAMGHDADRTHICLLPGSRMNELDRLLPIFVEAARILIRNRPGVDLSILRASTIPVEAIRRHLAACPDLFRIHDEASPVVLKSADFAWVASGTATLETALCLTPFLITYKTSWISYCIARSLIEVDFIGIVNVAAGRKIIPELIQSECTPSRIIEQTSRYLDDPSRQQQAMEDLKSVSRLFGEPGAAGRAVREILRICRLD